MKFTDAGANEFEIEVSLGCLKQIKRDLKVWLLPDVPNAELVEFFRDVFVQIEAAKICLVDHFAEHSLSAEQFTEQLTGRAIRELVDAFRSAVIEFAELSGRKANADVIRKAHALAREADERLSQKISEIDVESVIGDALDKIEADESE